ncbi:sensor histidine kinase [Frankia sp. CNm7]|uniref:Oxygen sensor histidine kinase NreB n=1 Tax=Frankia nepalensis TaxID=1836974 RepID=A0A937URL9_9ACTN|nr:sensor histidine kinase [Frankia nepalensis]MBL7498128.1 sensor histidine kinase [Frankia nepalensis]MBL7509354.1 sensor histidine kinase [Frankia nepalensis]MBL7516858.1 sensor histidine kinase [Frankia nepalensis]MBL7627916.1 sensor histidine kinase [Frankia nepalensis]
MSPPVPWVAPVLYTGVLLAGGYAGLAGLGDTRPLPFVGGLAAAAALDLAERRWFGAGAPRPAAVGLLAARAASFVLVAAGDGAGLARVLFLLLPFTAYFAFGRAVSVGVGAGCVAALAVAFQLTEPRWYRSPEHVSDLLMFVLGLVLTITMAAVAAEERRARTRAQDANERLRASSERVAELSAAAERNRVARDIHDGLGHHLTAISVLLEKAAAFRDRDPAAADAAVEDAHRSARLALDDVRRSVGALREAPFRLSTALDELARQARRTDDGRLAVTVDWSGDERHHRPAVLMTLYRAAQEGITNVRRHAHATRALVTVHCAPTEARLVVTDDGHGFEPGREGFGLRGMRERVALVGGSVTLDSGPGRGTRLAVAIPRQPEPAP